MSRLFTIRHITTIISIIILSLSHLFPGNANAAESLCAEVKLEIKQEVSLERQAFLAHMKINNGLTNISLEDVDIDVNFTDEDGNPVVASFDPNADPETTGARFWIRVDSMENINNVDGSGRVSPSASADIYWLIIPVPGAADSRPQGKLYYVGATLTYTIGGEENVTKVTPDYIYVKPMPELMLDYFITKNVYGDDAFTTQTEPSVPFTLGLRVKNTGSGIAKNLKIDSAQPKIKENAQGLLIGFAIEKCMVDDKPAANTLLANLGDIEPSTSGMARWIMTCSLSGEFVSFGATVSHSDELGGELTSIIKQENIHTHFLVRDVLTDFPGRDGIRDFLSIAGSSYKLFESDSEDSDVTNLSSSSSIQFQKTSGTEIFYTLSTNPQTGFVIIKLPDPRNGQMILKSITSAGGKQIKDENFWLSKERKANPADGWNHFINLFDVNPASNYTVVFDDPGTMPQAPVMAFIPDRSVIEGQEISFLVEASDPNGTIPVLSAPSLPVGASFTDQGNGTGIFRWTPSTGQAGIYNNSFTASDGILADTKRAMITVNSHDDTDGDSLNDDWEMAHFGTLDRDGTGDYDNDGISDYMEYLLGTDPTRKDTPPSVPVILSPAAGDEITSLTPVLTIENSTDPDSDVLTYDFEIFTDETLSQKVATYSGVTEGAGNTSATVSPALSENTSYVFRVRASDGVARSQWAYGSFLVNTANSAPSAFYISYPKNGTDVNSLTPMVQVSAANDPDRDLLTYNFEIYADSQMANLVASASFTPEPSDRFISWTVNQTLTDGSDYYFRATASDGNGAQTATALSMFSVNTGNHAPAIPVISSPVAQSEQSSLSVDLVVHNSTDGDGDTVTYLFEIDTAATFDSTGKIISGPIPEGNSQTTFHTTGLTDNTMYYFRVKASDGVTESPWALGSFFVNTHNEAPQKVILENPGDLSWVTTLTPVLSAAPAMDPDGDTLSYRFEVYLDPELTNLAAEGMSDQRTWTITEALTDNTRYFLRTQAQDPDGLTGEWSETAAFFTQMAETPQTINVTLQTQDGTPLPDIRIYAFNEAGSYLGLNADTDQNGIAVFNPADFSQGNVKFRAEYLGTRFWSGVITLPGTFSATISIPVETVTVSVATAAGPAENVKVYVFTAAGSYLGLNGTTLLDGTVVFTLPAGAGYDFRADIMGGQYFSQDNAVISGGSNQFSVSAGGGSFTITVQESSTVPMEGIRAYLFRENGSYLGANNVTDGAGNISFNVPQGIYKVRADYLGHQFWSAETLINSDTGIDLTIPHQDITITVSGLYDQAATPVENIPVYLFTEAGSYMNRTFQTNSAGQAVFHLPEVSYKVRADYRGLQFWSDPFVFADETIEIPMADAEVQVGWGDFYLEGVRVYAFTLSGSYLNLNQSTDENGMAVFRLPSAGNYKFRADYQAGQYWSENTTLVAGQVNQVPITTGGGTFSLSVLKGADDPLVGVMCYVFSESGTYFGTYGPTSSEGEVSFDLADGNYNIRVDYLGYQFWSPVLYDVPETLYGTITIPHQNVAITVSGTYQGTQQPVSSIPVYLFTPTGSYMNLNTLTDSNGQVVFNLPDKSYKVRADYRSRQFWSGEFIQTNTIVDIPMADAEVTVSGGGQPIPDIPVYVFTGSNSYLNMNQHTNTEGKAVFRLPASGIYKFRGDYQGSNYWSDEVSLVQDQVNPAAISTGGGPFTFTVLKGENTPLTGASCYVFSESGTYLGMNAVTSSEGQVSFELANGNYKFRVDYLGYKFWSTVYNVPAILNDTMTIPHQDVVVSINSVFQGVAAPLSGVPVYLFTQAGSYMSQTQTTDSNGQVVFNLPNKAYKVRADYRNQQFWSGEFIQTDTAVDIAMADAEITVTGAGQPLFSVPVYAFTVSGSYLNMNQSTNANGKALFRLPAGAYKFRADYQNNQYWSGNETLAAGQVNPIPISTGGGAFTLTVLLTSTDPLVGARCYAFSAQGSYLGMSGTTDTNGQVTFNLADGNYKYRVDYLGYQFWTGIYSVPDTLSDNYLIAHQDVVVTVEGLYQSTPAPLSGVKVYLFTSGGSYMSQNKTTDANGQVTFNLPAVAYKVRADYLGYQFWSTPFTAEDVAVTINQGLARVHVTRSGSDVQNARVYLFTGAGSYMNWNKYTDTLGVAEFLIPDRAYKFRADKDGKQVYSAVVTITPSVENMVEIGLQ